MKVNFRQIGEGDDVLLVHGWGGSIKSLEKLADSLSTKFKVTLLELPGHGESPVMGAPWNTEDFVGFVKKFIESQKLKNISYIGHSFGGHIGLKLGIENYPKIQKLILINSAGLKPRNSFKKTMWKFVSILAKPMISVLFYPVRKSIKMLLYKYVVRETDYAKTSGMIRETFKNVIKENVDLEVDKIKKPTFVIWGDKDTYTPLWMGIELHQKIKNSKFEVFEGTHSLPLKQYEIISPKIIEWLVK